MWVPQPSEPSSLRSHSELSPSVPNIVLMESCFLGEVLTTLSAGKGARRGTDLVYLAVPLQRGRMPKGLATVRTRKGRLGSGGYIRWGRPGAWTMAALVGDQGLGGQVGAAADEADEEGPLQLLGHKVCWVLPLHVTLLELGIGEGDEAVGALQGL